MSALVSSESHPGGTQIIVTIEGEPVSKQRPKFARSKTGHVYTPSTTRQAQETIAWHILAENPGLQADDASAFIVKLSFFTKNHARRDIDNMCKLVFDACNRVVWKDDAQVEELHATLERGSDRPRTEIVIDRRPLSVPTIVCAKCGKVARTYPSQRGKRFCSRACAAAFFRHGDVPCVRCGKLVHRADYQRLKTKQSFCSIECKSLALSVDLTCCVCGVAYARPRSQNRAGRKFCSATCSASFWRSHRARAAWGRCSVCGGNTSRKEYLRCNGCAKSAALREKGQQPSTVIELEDLPPPPMPF